MTQSQKTRSRKDPKVKIAVSKMALTEKLEEGDRRWAQFNDSFDNLALTQPDIMTQLAGGYAICPWMAGRRSQENFIGCQHIGVDMDTEDTRSSLDALLSHPLVSLFGGIVYTTPNHRPNTPRARVLFFLDRFVENAAEWTALAQFVTQQFDGADTAVAEHSRFFYGNINGDYVYVGNTMPVDTMRVFYRRALRLAAAERNADRKAGIKPGQTGQGSNQGYSQRDAGIIRLPQRLPREQEDEYQRTIEALKSFSPWQVDYNTWIGLITAMKREFGDRAREDVIRWAQGKPGEVEQEWDKRTKTNRPGKTMQINSIFFLAERFTGQAPQAGERKTGERKTGERKAGDRQ